MASVLVTGGSGFVGRHLLPELEAAGHSVVAPPRSAGDVADETTWSAYASADVVVHLAAQSSVPESWGKVSSYIRTNLLGTVAALNYCQRHGARLVLLSSYIYGNPSTVPIPESAAVVASNPYGLSKKLAEEACRFYADRCGVEVTVLRVFNVYGPGQSDSFVIPYIVRQAQAGEAIRVKDLEPRRDYVYVSDVVRAIATAVERQRKFEIFNIGSGVSHSVADVIGIVQGLCDSKLPVYSTGQRRQDEIMDTVADITAARTELGWEPRWTLAQGVRRMLDAAATGVHDVR